MKHPPPFPSSLLQLTLLPSCFWVLALLLCMHYSYSNKRMHSPTHSPTHLPTLSTSCNWQYGFMVGYNWVNFEVFVIMMIHIVMFCVMTLYCPVIGDLSEDKFYCVCRVGRREPIRCAWQQDRCFHWSIRQWVRWILDIWRRESEWLWIDRLLPCHVPEQNIIYFWL